MSRVSILLGSVLIPNIVLMGVVAWVLTKPQSGRYQLTPIPDELGLGEQTLIDTSNGQFFRCSFGVSKNNELFQNCSPYEMIIPLNR